METNVFNFTLFFLVRFSFFPYDILQVPINLGSRVSVLFNLTGFNLNGSIVRNISDRSWSFAASTPPFVLADIEGILFFRN